MFIFYLNILLIIFEIIQSDKILYQCTFDKNDLCRLKSFDNGSDMIIQTGYDILPSNQTIQPYSDVSSILKSTKNGYQCEIPYKEESYTDDLYFCYKSLNSIKCKTTNQSEDECQQGKYQILLLENIERRQFITPKINTITKSNCLTFYYYLTRKEIVLILTYYINDQNQTKLIDAFIDVPFNGWHLARQSFDINSTSFQIIFEIYRADMSNPSLPFYVAFDQITVTEDICGATLPPDENLTDTYSILTKSIDETTSEFDSLDTTLETIITTTQRLIETTEILNRNSFSTEIIKDSTKSLNEISTENQLTIDQTFATQKFDRQTTENIFLNNTTQNNNINSTTTKSPLQYSLGTVLGLSIGLGIPAALGLIGAFIYIIKLIKKQKKTKIIPIQHSHKQHRHHHRHTSTKQNDIPLKKQGHRRHHHHEKKSNRIKENIV